MSDNSAIMRDIQRTIREQLDDRRIALKVVAAKSGIPYSSLCSYFPGNERGKVPKQPAELPAGVLYSLCGAIPEDLLNLLLPQGFAIVRVPEGIDYDDISGACRDFIDAKERAHHPESEEGREIGPTENKVLRLKVAAIGPRAVG